MAPVIHYYAGSARPAPREHTTPTMIETPKRLRDAASALDYPRDDLASVDPDATSDEVKHMVNELDDVLADAQSVMRELAINEEVMADE